jgi:hypothetical protein
VNDQLSLQRLTWLLRSDLLRSLRTALVVSGTVALVALVVSLVDAYDRNVGTSFYRAVFVGALFAWGTIATSLSFGDLHGRGSNTAFLLLPASALEKTLARLLVYTVALILYLLVFTTVLSWLLEGINTLLFGIRREVFSPFDRLAWYVMPHFIVAQALFFAGAAWFRKASFVKTVGAVTAIVVGLACIAGAFAWAIGTAPTFSAEGSFPTFDWLVDAAWVVYVWLLPPFCWFVAWLRVAETQVSHGI